MHATRALAGALCAAALACRTPAPPRASSAPPAPAARVPSPDPAAAGVDAPAAAQPPDDTYGDDAAPPLAPEETATLATVRAELSRRGPPPRVSGALVRAARELARRAAAGAPAPLEQGSRRSALTAGGAYDAAPSAFLVRVRADRLPSEIAALGLPPRATHVGAGSVSLDGAVVVVVLASERKARLGAFPFSMRVGGAAPLTGVLEAGLSRARVYVTLPSGAVREADVTGGDAAFRASLQFATRGRYVVEVVGEGRGGPEVAALLEVTAGDAPPASTAARPTAPEPADRAAAEAGVVRAVNALRLAHGLEPVGATRALTEAARRHSERMLAEGRIAHVLPGSGELVDRLRLAQVPFRRAYENVARGETALAAHEAAEESPAHRANLLQPGVTRVGVGIARGTLPSGDAAVYLTEILVEPSGDGSEDRVAPEVRVREALWRERARLRVGALTLDPALDALAQDAAEAMRDADAPGASGLGDRALALRRGLAAVDVFVASAPSDAIRSANLRDARFRRVGVGVAAGDSRRFGAGRLFIAVVYTD